MYVSRYVVGIYFCDSAIVWALLLNCTRGQNNTQTSTYTYSLANFGHINRMCGQVRLCVMYMLCVCVCSGAYQSKSSRPPTRRQLYEDDEYTVLLSVCMIYVWLLAASSFCRVEHLTPPPLPSPSSSFPKWIQIDSKTNIYRNIYMYTFS